jgi:phosphoglycerol transferase MdoB-like AlkP superfamily enzyme
MGVRVDYAVLSVFTGIYWLLLTIPIRTTLNSIYKKTLGIMWGFTLALIFFYNIADIIYFGYVDRHITNEIYEIQNDILNVINMGISLYLLEIIVTLLMSLFVIYFFYKIFSLNIINRSIHKKEWLIFFLVIVIIFLGIRGKISGKPFTTSDAFAVNKLSSGNLALSGVYVLYRTDKNKNIKRDKIDEKTAIINVQNLIKSDNFKFIGSDKYPIMRKLKNPQKKNYNVVIVFIESFSAKYLDALSNNSYGVTPTLDKLAKDGQLYTNFYASGQRSQDAITTLYTGVTQPVGFTSIGSGLELYGLSYLGHIANKEGYSTLAMQSSKRSSFRVDVVSDIAGFKNYYGAEDIPKVGNEKGSPQFGTWDGNSFNFLHKKLNDLREPFLSFLFTASTHAPFFLPEEKYAKYPHSNKTKNGYLNTLYYVDQQIDQFMQKSKKEKWFDNTVFIFTADHEVWSSNFKDSRNVEDDSLIDGHHIPLIIYAPKILKPIKSNIISSQNDLMVSIIDLLGFKSEFSAIANSIFDTSVQNRFAHVKNGNVIGIGTKNGSVFYNYKEFMSSENELKKDKDTLLSIDKTQAYLLKNNMWSK